MKLYLAISCLALIVAAENREKEMPVFEIDIARPPAHRFNETVEFFRAKMDIVMPLFLEEFPPEFYELFRDYH